MTPDAPPRTAVVTLTRGRDAHLMHQRRGLALDPPDLHVVVGMGEPPHMTTVPNAPAATVVTVACSGGALPLAEARNTGARIAIRAGAEMLIFLDVDCIPGPELTRRYRYAAAEAEGLALLCGPVGYLPPAGTGGYPATGLAALAPLHPGRPAPSPGDIRPETRWELFWSLSFCVTAPTWARIGGFDEDFVGYGAEDTDFAFRAKARGAVLRWVGGAEAYHQHHEPSRADPQRALELLANARRFHARHGWWPMRDWLTDLSARGWIDWDIDAEEVVRGSQSTQRFIDPPAGNVSGSCQLP